MKYLHYFENLNVGDFIIIEYIRDAFEKKELNQFLLSNIGKVFGNSKNNIIIIYNIEWLKIPKFIRGLFTYYNDNNCKISISKNDINILYFSRDIKECELFIKTKKEESKFNL